VTVRANGVVKLKNIVIPVSNAVVDGFNVVGGTLGNPNYAIKFSGTGQPGPRPRHLVRHGLRAERRLREQHPGLR
jgi:hypothetical protein